MSQMEVIGWREWVFLTQFSPCPRLKTKIDTGARSSVIDATDIEVLEAENLEFTVKFRLQLKRERNKKFIDCEMPAYFTKKVRSSSGDEEVRPFVKLPIQVGDHAWTIEASLTDRGNMVNRMLLGRRALHNCFLVNPTQSFLFGKPKTK